MCVFRVQGYDDGDEAGVPYGDHLHRMQLDLLLLLRLDEKGSWPAARVRVADVRDLPGEDGRRQHETLLVVVYDGQ